MTKLVEKTRVRCHCGSIIEVHPNEIKTANKSDPIMVNGDMGEFCAGQMTQVTKTCTCPCKKKDTVTISHYSSGGYNTGPGGYSHIVP